MLAMRGIGMIIAVLTLVFLVLDLTANADIFLVPDLVLAAILIGAALIPNPQLAALGLLLGYAYTAGVFSLSVAIAVVRGPMTLSTVVGLAVTVVCAALLIWWMLRARGV
jgi:hypothetical protein